SQASAVERQRAGVRRKWGVATDRQSASVDGRATRDRNMCTADRTWAVLDQAAAGLRQLERVRVDERGAKQSLRAGATDVENRWPGEAHRRDLMADRIA